VVTEIDLLMELGDCEPFAVIVADINGLKKTNDRYGHEIGNRLIIKASKIICDVFKHSPIYRIGGDEFVVLLRGRDYENREALLATMDEQYSTATIMAGEETIPVTVARALEECDLNLDLAFDDVFNRADKKMYEHKHSTRQKEVRIENATEQ
jgi:diguanylate cyclase (GGDEF)-like protein